MPTKDKDRKAKRSKGKPKAGRAGSLNPLAVAFGTALRQIRNRQNKSTRHIASESGEEISNSYYRLIESGRNNLSVGKAPFLHRKFQGEPRLEYEPLIFLIGTIAASEERTASQKRNKSSRGEQLDQNVTAICQSLPENHPFRVLLGRFLEPLEQRGICESGMNLALNAFQSLDQIPERVRDIVTAAKLDAEVVALLTKYSQYVPLAQAPQEYAQDFFTEIPTFYKPMLDSLKRNLRHMPKAVVPEGSWEWEREIRRDFKELVAVCYAKHVVTKENLRQYRFTYLWNQEFLKATFILLDEKDPREAHKQFWLNLESVLKEDRSEQAQDLLHRYNDSLQSKTFFLAPCTEERRELMKLLKDLSEGFKLNAIWFFKTTDSAVIGAAAEIDDNTKTARGIKFLTFGDCERALPTIAKYHTDIQV